MNADLAALFTAWTPIASLAVTRWLAAHGLPHDVDRHADALYGVPTPELGEAVHANPELVLGAAPVRPHGPDFFEIDEGGKWAMIQPVTDGADEITDLIAWHPARPDRWRYLTGEGEALGKREVEIRIDLNEPINVYATPRSWLAAGGRGACMLRMKYPRADNPHSGDWIILQRIFHGERKLIAETVELAERLDFLLKYRPSPTVYVRRHHLEVAA
jgi:hypothetical protein